MAHNGHVVVTRPASPRRVVRTDCTKCCALDLGNETRALASASTCGRPLISRVPVGDRPALRKLRQSDSTKTACRGQHASRTPRGSRWRAQDVPSGPNAKVGNRGAMSQGSPHLDGGRAQGYNCKWFAVVAGYSMYCIRFDMRQSGNLTTAHPVKYSAAEREG